MKAIRFRNLDEARQVLETAPESEAAARIFDDGGEEPQGLLSVIPEDRLAEENFYSLFESKTGTLVEVERIRYSGYGPPAEEQDYMGFMTENVAYVLNGRRFSIEIHNCPAGAQDIYQLEAMVLDNAHPLDREHLAQKLELRPKWDFDELVELIREDLYTADEIDRLIHQGCRL